MKIKDMRNRNKNFSKLGSLMGIVSKKMGIDRGLKEITLINMWPDIVGPRFKNKTKAISLRKKGIKNILIVAVESASYAQELSFFKKEILKKLSPASLSLQFNISDVVFDTKLWEDIKKYKRNDLKKVKNEESIVKYIDKEPTQEELDNIDVPQEVIKTVENSVQTHEFSTDELRNKILKTIINDIKTQIWQKNNGFPCCKECGIPMKYHYIDRDTYCPSCRKFK